MSYVYHVNFTHEIVKGGRAKDRGELKKKSYFN